MSAEKYAEAFGLPGGPAFPVSIPGSGDNGAWGMSLRDWFAGKALTAMASATQNPAEAASASYEIADAMLDERKSEPDEAALASELLAALKSWVEPWDGLSDAELRRRRDIGYQISGIDNRVLARIFNSRAAIARAEGRAP